MLSTDPDAGQHDGGVDGFGPAISKKVADAWIEKVLLAFKNFPASTGEFGFPGFIHL